MSLRRPKLSTTTLVSKMPVMSKPRRHAMQDDAQVRERWRREQV